MDPSDVYCYPNQLHPPPLPPASSSSSSSHPAVSPPDPYPPFASTSAYDYRNHYYDYSLHLPSPAQAPPYSTAPAPLPTYALPPPLPPPIAFDPQSHHDPRPGDSPGSPSGDTGSGGDGPEGSSKDRSQEPRLSNAKMSKRPKPRPPPPEGVTVTDKSCSRCRVRKVRCNRQFPRCDHCTARNEECDLVEWRPKPKVKPHDAARVAELEKRLAELEEQIAKGAPGDGAPSQGTSGPEQNGGPSDPSSARQHGFSLPSEIRSFNPCNAVQSASASSSQPAITHASGGGLPFLGDKARAPRTAANIASPDSPASPSGSNIGSQSIDWRLATPQMAASLSRHLCEAFFESCCFLLPAFEYFKPKSGDFLRDGDQLTTAGKVALTSFAAVGARTSPHSALLGISIKPEDTRDHPNAPLLSAGTRRQNACQVLLTKAHRISWDLGVMEHPTVENLAAVLSLLQLSLFTEVAPAKSRPLLRSAFSHFKELQDAAPTDQERADLRHTFGFAIYSADCLISSYARRKCHLSDEDLRTYFAYADTKIVVPRLPTDSLLPLVEKLVSAAASKEAALKSAMHLLACWTCACQRAFVQLAAPPVKTLEETARGIPLLWTAIDSTRTAAQLLLTVASPGVPHSQSHTHSSDANGADYHSVHETDYGAQIIRLDRDLLDLVNLTYVLLKGLRAPGLPELLKESTSRVRKGLKRRAYYFQLYVHGADVHMCFHEQFQLEHVPNWPQLALQRVGDPDGPQNAEEEVTETELNWLIEGLQHACYYHPDAEKRLGELAPRFTTYEGRIDLSPRVRGLASLPPLPPFDQPSSQSFVPIQADTTLLEACSPALSDGFATGSFPPLTPINFDKLSPLQFSDTGFEEAWGTAAL
ncbi:hypothetical protein JCM21900_001025 [Sporobolomyces salmonicolor]